MKNILENALNGETVSFNTRTYGVDASLTEMLFGPWGPVNLNPAGAFFNRVDPIAPVEPIKPLSTWGAVIPIPTTIELPVMDIHETFKIFNLELSTKDLLM